MVLGNQAFRAGGAQQWPSMLIGRSARIRTAQAPSRFGKTRHSRLWQPGVLENSERKIIKRRKSSPPWSPNLSRRDMARGTGIILNNILLHRGAAQNFAGIMIANRWKKRGNTYPLFSAEGIICGKVFLLTWLVVGTIVRFSRARRQNRTTLSRTGNGERKFQGYWVRSSAPRKDGRADAPQLIVGTALNDRRDQGGNPEITLQKRRGTCGTLRPRFTVTSGPQATTPQKILDFQFQSPRARNKEYNSTRAYTL